MTVTPIYAGLISLLFVALSFRVIGFRRQAKVALGDGGNTTLTRRLRAHGNFAEYVPLAVVLMALAELQGQPAFLLHLMGVGLLAGRLIHAFGVSREPEDIRLRVTGMVLTLSVLIFGALANLGFSSLSGLIAA
jgi:uncharacterized membrane protein YecN with MAPEG domain